MWKSFIKKHWLAFTVCTISTIVAIVSFPRQNTNYVTEEIATPGSAAVTNQIPFSTHKLPEHKNNATITPPKYSDSPPANIATTSLTNTTQTTQTYQSAPRYDTQITITITSTTYDISVSEGASVYDALRLLAAAHPVDIKYKNFGTELGYMLQSINNTANDYRTKYYWIYYLNGKKATIGISNNILHSGDNITWQYEQETF
jgi:hypothetical protein